MATRHPLTYLVFSGTTRIGHEVETYLGACEALAAAARRGARDLTIKRAMTGGVVVELPGYLRHGSVMRHAQTRI